MTTISPIYTPVNLKTEVLNPQKERKIPKQSYSPKHYTEWKDFKQHGSTNG